VPGDTNDRLDVFVHDRATGETTRVSVDSSGAQGDGFSLYASISADGRFVAFASNATNLVPGDTNGCYDAFVHDRLTGTTERVSVDSSGAESDKDTSSSMISGDGLSVCMATAAALAPGDTNNLLDVYAHDRVTGQTTRVSVSSSGQQGTGTSRNPSISADGRIVAFQSLASNLVPNDTNSAADVFVHDRMTSTTTLVSVDSAGGQGNSTSATPSVSADGSLIAFASGASNLVAGDTNGETDVFVHDRTSGSTTRESLGSGGLEGDSYSDSPSISGDGNIVSFTSHATNLVPGDVNGHPDILVRDRSAGTTVLASTDAFGAPGNLPSYESSVSAEGGQVAFMSDATNLVPGDTNGYRDVFVRECSPGGLYCFGDGSGTLCPCGNTGGPEEGCANSTGSGARLWGSGSASVSADSLRFLAAQLVPSQPALLFAGLNAVNNGDGLQFGDGLRCAGGSVVRLGTQTADATGQAEWGPGLGAMGGWLPGDVRRFQVWYRDPSPPGPCGSGFNLTNGVEILFGA
jgi:Tol biopolymer transport system component